MVHKGNGVQIIYGPKVTVIKSNFEDYLETAPDEELHTMEEETTTSKNEKTDEEKQSGKVKKQLLFPVRLPELQMTWQMLRMMHSQEK